MMLWISLTLVLGGVAFFVGARRQAKRDLRILATDMAALRPDEAAPASLDDLRARLTGLGDQLTDGQTELAQMRIDREERIRSAEQEQRLVNGRMRRRAKEAIDDTGAVISERLQDVVEQVHAARQAATATHERVAVTSAAAATMVRRARSADEAANALNESLNQVAGIANVISEIASQTRMLALNATIEAARAGAAGKGFAVVADEVKNLADTTATSTEQITATIRALEADVQQMGETLTAIVEGVGEIETAMGTLDGIADEQHQIVERLNGTVDETMERITDLSEVAERLERRSADRLATDGEVALRTSAGAAPAVGRLTDLSTGGLGCMMPPRTPIRVGDQLQASVDVNNKPQTLSAQVVRRREVDAGVELGLSFSNLSDDAKRQIEIHIQKLFEAI
jgi:methyl-accepting chemotaxis protein